MCDDVGVVVEDGVVGRLDEDRFVLTTTSSGAQRTWRRIERVVQEHFANAAVLPALITEDFASLNVTGPAARHVLSSIVSDCAIDTDSFPFMHVRGATVAGIEGCFVWRIGFTGELSFEMHVPAGAGMDVWSAVFDAGERYGIRPFGVEAQRILRTEKGHFVIGQDTDAATTPFELGLGRMVGTDKGDFVGQVELENQRARDPLRRLVGIQCPELLPESSLIVDDGRSIGRVTTSKWSPTLGCCVALGLLDSRQSNAGSPIVVRRVDGSLARAELVPGVCHVDPSGGRSRG
jgi:sarcosine oxidase subunit alpha